MALPAAEKKFLEDILDEVSGLDSPVLFLLHRLQDHYGQIKPEHAKYISASMNRPLAEIYSAVTFYDEFRQRANGNNVIRICRGITCHTRGSREILKAISGELGIEDGETTDDGLFTLEEASCIGQCDGAPAMMINDEVHRHLTPAKALDIVKKKKGGD